MKRYSLIAGILFALVALAHFFRLAQGWEITVDGKLIPMWVSWVGLVVTAILAYWGVYFGAGKDEHHNIPAVKA